MAAKYQLLAQILRRELMEGRSGAKLPTEQELSARYQMSRQTVRHALQLLAEEGLIQRRQGSGSFATGKRQPTAAMQIAIITSFLDDYIFPVILHDAQSLFSQAGYSTLLYTTENQVGKEREVLKSLLESQISGILVEGSKTALPTPNADLYQRLEQKRIPLLFLHGAYSNLSGVHRILDDNYGGGYALTRHLLKQGHKKFAGIFKSDDIQGPQRYHGVVSALRDAEIAISDRRFAWYDTEDRRDMLEENAAQVLERFISQRMEDATAVICYNDEVARLLIRKLLSMGKRVPDDVAVVSFDNSYYSQIGPIPITSLGHKSHIGKFAAEQLLALMHGKQMPDMELDWELIKRQSS